MRPKAIHQETTLGHRAERSNLGVPFCGAETNLLQMTENHPMGEINPNDKIGNPKPRSNVSCY